MSHNIKVKDKSFSKYETGLQKAQDSYSDLMLQWILSKNEKPILGKDRNSPNIFVDNLLAWEQANFNKLRLYEAAVEGIPKRIFLLLLEKQPFTLREFGELLSWKVSDIELVKEKKTRVEKMRTEKMIELAEVLAKGNDVFGDEKKLLHWLKTPNIALGKRRPFDLIKTSYGKDLVIDELIKIEHGVFA
jgi:putative toxin-antitoxin system antitoxin component (TIGR02293 family)